MAGEVGAGAFEDSPALCSAVVEQKLLLVRAD